MVVPFSDVRCQKLNFMSILEYFHLNTIQKVLINRQTAHQLALVMNE